MQQAAKNDLVAILEANTPAKSSLAVKERLTFTIERASLKGLLEELREERLSLKAIIKGMKTQQEYAAREPSHDARRLATAFEKVQTSANSLFTAICQGLTCKCQIGHKVMIRLDSRVPLQQRRPKLVRKAHDSITFNLCFSVEDEALQEALQEAWVMVHQIDPSLDENQDQTSSVPIVYYILLSG